MKNRMKKAILLFVVAITVLLDPAAAMAHGEGITTSLSHMPHVHSRAAIIPAIIVMECRTMTAIPDLV